MFFRRVPPVIGCRNKPSIFHVQKLRNFGHDVWKEEQNGNRYVN